MTASESGRDGEDVVFRGEYNWAHDEPSTAIIEAIAGQTRLEPTEMEPLYASVDPEALDTLIRGNGMGVPGDELTVSFRYNGYTVVVRSSGKVELSNTY